MKTHHPWGLRVLGALAAILSATLVNAAPPPEEQTEDLGGVPPRLSYTHGEVSFWRPGAEDWTPAQVNTPLAPGDALFSAGNASLEVQIGGQAFLRAGYETELGLTSREPNYLQFGVRIGQVALDLRSWEQGQKIEIDTPNAAFTIEATGYYRVDVSDDATAFTARSGGRATMLSSTGVPSPIGPGERLVVTGTNEVSVSSVAAPDLDAWDQWNDERTNYLLDSDSARYVSPDVYGVDELDRYGSWSIERDYGPVWIPAGIGPTWAPYTVGRWIWDPFYGWTWIDAAPWGWAPCHYGRWVRVRSHWAWAPGPAIPRPVYAPAVVAFFGGPRLSVGVGLGVPTVGWLPLGWGEPILPWWGSTGFIGVPWWGGWGGPRVVNNVVIRRTTVIHAHDIHGYCHARVRHAFGFDRQDRFGRGPYRADWRNVDSRRLRAFHGSLPMRPAAASLAPRSGHAMAPPDQIRRRPVVATRHGTNVEDRLRAAGLRVPHQRAGRQHIVSRRGVNEPAVKKWDPREKRDVRSRRPPAPLAAEGPAPRSGMMGKRDRGRRVPSAATGSSPRTAEPVGERRRPIQDHSSGRDRFAPAEVPVRAPERHSIHMRPPHRVSKEPRHRAPDRLEPSQPAPSTQHEMPARRMQPPAYQPHSRMQRNERPSRRSAPAQHFEPGPRQVRPGSAAPQAARPRAVEPTGFRPRGTGERRAPASQPSYRSGSRYGNRSVPAMRRPSMGNMPRGAPSGGRMGHPGYR